MPKIGHVHIKVADLKKAEEFYTKLLGFRVSERVGNYLFLSFGKLHHDLALQELQHAEHPTENMIGLYHFAIELENLKQLADIYFKLKKHGINISPIDHGISKTIYLSDLDGNGIEVYVEARNKRSKWHGMSTLIQEEDFRKWLNQN